MTDINIRIRSTLDGNGLAQARKDVESLVAAMKGVGGTRTADPGYARISTEAAKAGAQVERLAQAQQRTANAASQAATAAQRLATEEQRTATAAAQAAAAQSRAEKAALQLAQAQQKAAQASQQTGGYFQQMSGAITSGIMGIVGPAAIAGTAIAAIGKGLELAQAGAEAGKVEGAFNRLAKQAGTTGDALMAAMRSASGGEISDLNLQLAANKANLLGVATSAEQLSTLMEIAKDRAQSMGISTTQAFDNLVTGLGRGSALILDNLGIMVKESEVYNTYAASVGKSAAALSDAEKKQALINAVVAQGKASLDGTAAGADTAAASFTRMGTAVENAKNRFGEWLAVQLKAPADGITMALTKEERGLERQSALLAKSGADYAAYAAAVSQANADVARKFDSGQTLGGQDVMVKALSEAQFNYAKSLEATGASAADANAKALAMNDTFVSIGQVQEAAAATTVNAGAAIDQLSNSMLRVAETGPAGQAAVDSLTQAYLAGGLTIDQFQAALGVLIERNTQHVAITMQSADAEDRRTAATMGSIIAQQQAAAATILEAQAKEQSTAQSQLLEAQIQMVAQAYMALNPNIDGAGVASAVAAGKIDAAVGTYINMTLATAKARAELAALQAQAGMAGGAVEGRSERDTPADRAGAAAAGAAAQRERAAALAAAKSAQVLATGTTAAKRAELQKQYNDAVALHGRESAEAINAQTKLLQAEQSGGGRRTSTKAATGQRLATIEQNTGQKLADIDKATQAKLAAIDRKAAEDRIAAARRLNQAMQTNAAQRRADNEVDDLDLIGVKNQKEAAKLNDRERAQAASREREKAAAAEARDAMAAGDAETGEKVYAAREEQISKQQALDEAYYAKQRELAGDPAAQEALKQQYDEATRAIDEATQLQIEFAHAAADEKTAAAQAEKDAVVAAAEEQKNAVIGKAQESAAGIKNATASAKAAAVADLQAIGAAVNAIPSNKTVTVTVNSSGGGGGSAGAQGRSDGAYAGGGDFVTNGPTTITVGDNPGGREFVSVVPISGTGTTRPVAGGLAMAGGGTVDAGDGYTTPIAGDTGGSKGSKKKKGKGSSKGSSDAAADIKDKIDEQKNLIQLLSDMLALRADMARELESGTPFNVGFAQALAKKAAMFAQFVRAALPAATKDEAEGYKRAAENSRDGIAVLSDLIQLRKDMSDYKDVNPFDVAFVERLAATGKRIVALVQSQLVPTTQAEVDRMQRWADLNGSVVGLIKDVSSLNAQMFSDYVPPSDAQLNAIARDANRIAQRMVAIARTYDTKGLDAAKQFVDAVGGTFSAFKDGLLFFQALNSGDFVLNPGNLAKFEKSTMQTMAVAARLGAMARKIPSQDLASLQLTTQALGAQAEALIKLAAVPFADLPAAAQALNLQSGALLGGARGAGGGNTIYLNVYAQPGMNIDQLATVVAQKIGGSAKKRVY